MKKLFARTRPDPQATARTVVPASGSDANLFARLGRQIEANELTERDLAVWAWIYGRYMATGGFRFNWTTNGRNLGFGGVDALAASLSALQSLGWISCREDADGDVQVLLSP